MTDDVEYYYYDPKIINLDKIREECYEKSHDTRMGPPSDCYIHYHKVGRPCSVRCEFYPAEKV